MIKIKCRKNFSTSKLGDFRKGRKYEVDENNERIKLLLAHTDHFEVDVPKAPKEKKEKTKVEEPAAKPLPEE